jgi:hypothetical protein
MHSLLDGGNDVLQKCANPACTVPFRSLREGKLFLAENHEFEPAPGSVRKNHREHFWLCESCSSRFTLRFDSDRGVVTVPLPDFSRLRLSRSNSTDQS